MFMFGSHQIDLEFYRCRADPELYTSYETACAVLRIISGAGFEVYSHTFVNFPNSKGFTLLVVIAESYVAVSTWPEYGYVQITISFCNHTQNNFSKARRLEQCLRKLYQPKLIFRRSQPRGPLKKYI